MPRVDVRGGLRLVCALLTQGDAAGARSFARELRGALEAPRPVRRERRPRVDVRANLRVLRSLLSQGDAATALAHVEALEAALTRPAPSGVEEALQLRLAAIARALPVLGCPLGSSPAAVLCVARQIRSELDVGIAPAAKRSSRAKRGTATSYPTCRTHTCALGRSVREALGDDPEARAMAKRAHKPEYAVERDRACEVSPRGAKVSGEAKGCR